MALAAAVASGRHWQLSIDRAACEAGLVTIGARVSYRGPKGPVEAPVSRIVDAAGKRFPAKSLVWRGGSKALAQWLPAGGLWNVQGETAVDVDLKFDVQGAAGELSLEFGDIESFAVCGRDMRPPRRAAARPGEPASFLIYRASYPCRQQEGTLRTLAANHPPYLPRQLLFFGHGFLPNARHVELPMGTAPAQSYAYAGVDSLDAVDAAARRALGGDFPRLSRGLAQSRYFAFNWGVQKSQSGNEAYSIGIYDLRDC